jgi:alanyl-tRNA synthetase
VNERIVANDPVSWSEVPYVEAKANNGIMALFGEKYGDLVRVVQIGGQPHKLDGWSMELCGGTHTRGTGEIGLFRLVAESAVAAGVRRIEAIAGWKPTTPPADADFLKLLAGKVSAQGAPTSRRSSTNCSRSKKSSKKPSKPPSSAKPLARAKELLSLPPPKATSSSPTSATDADYAMAVAMPERPVQRHRSARITGGGNVALMATVAKEFTKPRSKPARSSKPSPPSSAAKAAANPTSPAAAAKMCRKVDAALAEARKLIG